MDNEIAEALSRLFLVSGGPERGTSAPDRYTLAHPT